MEENRGTHSTIIENRKKAEFSGVNDVMSYDENCIIMDTCMGTLTVKGEELHISGFNKSAGELSITGTFFGMAYSDGGKSSSFRRIFK